MKPMKAEAPLAAEPETSQLQMNVGYFKCQENEPVSCSMYSKAGLY